MKRIWMPVATACPRCGQHMTILEVLISSKMEIQLDGCCPKCGIELTSGPRLLLEFIQPEKEA